jgi:hypothetical protein
LLGKPAIKPDAPFPALDCCGGKTTPGLPCQVSMNGVSSILLLELEGDSIEGIHRLGWEFQILVPISGTPIVGEIPIPFLIPKILVRIIFAIPMSGESENWNSDFRYSEFW